MNAGLVRCVVVAVSFATICEKSISGPPEPAQNSKQCNVVATVLPAYLVGANLTVGVPNASTRMLLDPALGCPHSYSLTPADRRALENATQVIAIGAGMEGFLDKLRPQLPNAKFFTLSEACKLRELEGEDDPHADHDHDHAVNPHAWMSPRQYIKMVEWLGPRLLEEKDDRAARIKENQAEYVKRLGAVAKETDDLAGKIKGKKVVGGEAVEYLLADLQLDVVARLPGHEGEGESAAQLLAISNAIRKEKPVAIIVESGRSDRVAATFAKEHGLELIELDAVVQCEKSSPPSDHYETVMRKNLASLARALSPG